MTRDRPGRASSGKARWVSRLVGLVLVAGVLVALKVMESHLRRMEARQAARRSDEGSSLPQPRGAELPAGRPSDRLVGGPRVDRRAPVADEEGEADEDGSEEGSAEEGSAEEGDDDASAVPEDAFW